MDVKVLLDTNILIEREASVIGKKEVGYLFSWLDKLHYEKCIHNLTLEEIKRHGDEKVKAAFKIKLESYNCLKTEAEILLEVSSLSQKIDKTANDLNDTKLINELFSKRVDFLITEDKKIHKKATILNIQERVFTIESFLEKVTSENPILIEYKTLPVKKKYFGHVDFKNSFFDSFRKNYEGFDEWFNKKSEEPAYICSDPNNILAFLYLKKEGVNEDYDNIEPKFQKKVRLKIGTFKVVLNGFKLGERFLKIIFDNAIKQKIDEIYVTIFNDGPEKKRLINLLSEWGFTYWGIKNTSKGNEEVYVRDFSKKFNILNPKLTFPRFSINSEIFIVPIYPNYHTSLFPDSILNTESPDNYVENEPFRNALSKVYVSRSFNRNLKRGDLIVFYRTGGYFEGVVTTIGIVESVITEIKNEAEFISLCRKRSVFDNRELSEQWNYSTNKPFIVNFLYTYSFPKRINMKSLIDLKIIPNINSAPRGFEKISKENFVKILKNTLTDEEIIAKKDI